MMPTSARYRPGDQDDWLGEPPWSPSDPALIAWEAAHGHDVRSKCYPEFGCKVIQSDLEDRIDELETEVDKTWRDATIAALTWAAERVGQEAAKHAALLQRPGGGFPEGFGALRGVEREIRGRIETEQRVICSQCGEPYHERACGPTHALIWHERSNR